MKIYATLETVYDSELKTTSTMNHEDYICITTNEKEAKDAAALRWYGLTSSEKKTHDITVQVYTAGEFEDGDDIQEILDELLDDGAPCDEVEWEPISWN